MHYIYSVAVNKLGKHRNVDIIIIGMELAHPLLLSLIEFNPVKSQAGFVWDYESSLNGLFLAHILNFDLLINPVPRYLNDI